MHSNIKLRIISIFTAVCMCVTFLSVSAGAVKTEVKNGADAIVETAVSQIGYYEGADGYSKYGDYFGHPNTPWCCAFVSWCARITGIPSETIPTKLSCTDMRSYFIDKGLYHKAPYYGGSYTPEPGDLVFFSWSSNPDDIGHIGIIEKANSSYATCIEGNCPNRVRQIDRNYNSTIVGFVSPAYGDVSVNPPEDIKTKEPGKYKLTENMFFRKAPSENAEKLMEETIKAGTVIEAAETKFADKINWGKIEYEGLTGWICLDYSVYYKEPKPEPKPEQKPEDTKKTAGIYVLQETMNLRKSPNTGENNIITTIEAFTEIQVTETDGRWGKTEYKGNKGWLRLDWSKRIGDLPVKPEPPVPDEPEKETDPEAETKPEVIKPEDNMYRVTYTTNLRERPTTDSDKIGEVPEGKLTKVTETKGNWGKTTVDGVTGWFCLDWSVRFAPEVDWLMIDISVFQNPDDIDWNKLREQGVKGAIIRIGGRGGNSTGTGNLYSDTAFLRHYKNAKAAGLHVGTYFFSYAITPEQAEEEARFTLNLLKTYKADLDLPVFIDMEDLTGDDTHMTAGKEACTAVLESFCSTIENSGYYAGIYSSTLFIEKNIDLSVYNGRAAWIAEWNDYEHPLHNGRVDMWQYTENGQLDGITGNVDLNRCYIDFPSLIKGLNNNIRNGDTDRDGKITSSDARLVLRASVSLENLSPAQIKISDIDKDGKITASDAREILKMSVM